MIKNVKIENFEGLNLEIKNIPEVLLVSGKNGVGKSRLLKYIHDKSDEFKSHVINFKHHNYYVNLITPTYNDLLKKNNKKSIINDLKVLEPRLNDIEIRIDYGNRYCSREESFICCILDKSSLKVNEMNFSFIRFFYILSSIIHLDKNTNILIDDIGFELHHSVMTEVIRVILKRAKEKNIQIIATTQSRDVIKSFSEIFGDDDTYDNFMYGRIDNIDGKTKFKTYSSKMLQTAVESDLEIR